MVGPARVGDSAGNQAKGMNRTSRAALGEEPQTNFAPTQMWGHVAQVTGDDVRPSECAAIHNAPPSGAIMLLAIVLLGQGDVGERLSVA